MADKEDAPVSPGSTPADKSALPTGETAMSVDRFVKTGANHSSEPAQSNRADDAAVRELAKRDRVAAGFYKAFMNPQLDQLERSIHQNTAILDDLTKQWDEERRVKQYEDLTKHVPQELKGEGQSIEAIYKKVQEYFEYENYTDGINHDKLTPSSLKDASGEELQLSILSHALAAYVATLEASHAQNLSARINSDISLWLSKVFRYKESSAYCHEVEYEGLVRVARLALQLKYPDYVDKGFGALLAKPPIIYVSAAAPTDVGEMLCSQLGLPTTSLCIVPCLTKPGQLHRIDVDRLAQLITEHEASLRSPLLLLAYAGTPVLGAVDNIQKIKELCKAHSIWLHVSGDHLATLSLLSVPTSVQPARTGDSITLTVGNWLGLVAIPHVTLFSSADSAAVKVAGLAPPRAANQRLECFPLWVSLQKLGFDGVIKRIKNSCELAKSMFEKLAKLPGIKIVNKKVPKKDDGSASGGIVALIGKVLGSILIFEIVTPTVVFKYGGDDKSKEMLGDHILAPYAPHELTEVEQEKKSSLERYYDSLNVWFVETMKREVPAVQVEAVSTEEEGIVVKFTPLQTAVYAKTTEKDIDDFCSAAERQISIMDATLRHRESFQAVVEAQDNLLIVEIPHWAGLGAIRYIPDQWLDRLDNLPQEGIDEINRLNVELVHQLKANDSAFSLGRTYDDLACARFGLITEDTDMEELIGLVYTTAKAIDEESKYVEKLAEVVRKGIEEANKDIEKANEEKLLQEGVLRQMPLVGSLINWFSPPPKDGTRGRTFNLASGRILSTEETYKLHMQIQEEPLQSTLSAAAAKKGPLKASLKPAKTRTDHSLSSSLTLESPSCDSGSLSNSTTKEAQSNEGAPEESQSLQ